MCTANFSTTSSPAEQQYNLTLVLLHAEKKLVHSQLTLTLNETSAAPLLVISPNHGKVEYKWEKRVSSFMNEWKSIEVPPWTCLVYATTPAQYRCAVDSSAVVFNVKGWYINYV